MKKKKTWSPHIAYGNLVEITTVNAFSEDTVYKTFTFKNAARAVNGRKTS